MAKKPPVARVLVLPAPIVKTSKRKLNVSQRASKTPR